MSRIALALGGVRSAKIVLAMMASLLLPGGGGALVGVLAARAAAGGPGQSADLVTAALWGFAAGLAGLGCGLCFLAAYASAAGMGGLRRIERYVKRELGELRHGQDRLASVVDYSTLQNGKAFSNKPRDEESIDATGLHGVPAARAEEMFTIDRCSVCGCQDYSLAVEYNRFILRLDAAPDRVAARYDYSLCHDCGTLFATRRPRGARYRQMLHAFTETLGRTPKKGGLLNPAPLDDDDRADLRRRAKRGVFVSDHEYVANRAWLPAMLRDRMANAVHVELIGSLAELDKPRVLELRPRTGAISAALRRLYGADVYGMPMFESQQFCIREYYGIPADHVLDYDEFEIPYAGPFDLVVSNHMLTHVIDPQRYFGRLRDRMKPGAFLYMYNEPDDAEFLSERGMVFSVLNPFHLQTFDLDSFVRALRANQFEAQFVTRDAGEFVCMARYRPGLQFERMSAEDLKARRIAYQRARDSGVLRVPDEVRPLFRDEWEGALRRSCQAGIVEFDDRGRPVIQTAQ